MSGIVGILHLDGSPVDRAQLEQLTAFLAFRGPDAQHTWCEGSIGFGHTLLRTAAESQNEQQPLTLEGATVTADARVDAREELIAALAARGRHVSLTTCDAELILHAYHVWGENCAEHLLGDFAFAIWDARQQCLFCARDHFGLKPFFCARVGETFLFSNTLDALRFSHYVSDELNEQTIADFLLFDFNPDPSTTCFAQIRRLPAAHTLRVACNAECFRRYWSVPVRDPIRFARPADYVDRFRELLRAAVRDRLPTGPVSLLMSGGLDSTTVAATAREVAAASGAETNFRAFTIVYDRLIPHDERRFASDAASHLQIPIEFIVADDHTLYKDWQLPEMRRPEPLHDPLLLTAVEQLRAAVAHSRVAFSGYGGDNLLHSQVGPYLAFLFRRLQWLRLVHELGGFVLANRRLPPLLIGLQARWQRILGRKQDRPTFPGWFTPDFESRYHLRERWNVDVFSSERTHPYRPASYSSTVAALWARVFEFEDAGATRFPLEIRHPMFDVRLVEFLLALPALPWCVDKHVLRVAMRGSLPDSVLSRPKSPLAADVVSALIRRGDTEWLKRFQPGPELGRFVRPGFVPSLDNDSELDLWTSLRPVTLCFWLQSLASPGYKPCPLQ